MAVSGSGPYGSSGKCLVVLPPCSSYSVAQGIGAFLMLLSVQWTIPTPGVYSAVTPIASSGGLSADTNSNVGGNSSKGVFVLHSSRRLPPAETQPSGFLRCAYSNDSMTTRSAAAGGGDRSTVVDLSTPEREVGTEDCMLQPHEGNSPSDKAAFCYILFRNNSETNQLQPTLRGCWMGGEHECLERALGDGEDQRRGACYNRRNGDSVLLFCCCIGYMCNDHTFEPLPPPVEASVYSAARPQVESQNAQRRSHSPAAALAAGVKYVFVPLVGLIAVILLTWLGGRRLRRRSASHHSSGNGLLAAASQFGYDNACEKSGSLAGEASRSPSSMTIPLKSVTLVQLAAQGRFGAVWRGVHRDTPVAVKIFPAGERQSWEKEIEVYRLPQMQHANVLRFVGCGQKSDTQTNLTEYWLLTSWHQLGSLYDYLRFHMVQNYSQLLQLCDSIVKGVMHLHTEIAPIKSDNAYKPAMAHRDIKSKNIILKDDRTACIADFGLAIIFQPGVDIGETHGQVGTRRYMAPEVLEGAISFDQEAFQRIDMYAVALCLWEILARTKDCCPFSEYRLPFEDQVGQHPSLEDMQETVVNRKMRPQIRLAWRDDSKLSRFVCTLEECWDADADARLSASTVHERIQQLIRKQWSVDMDSEKTALLAPLQHTSPAVGLGITTGGQHQLQP